MKYIVKFQQDALISEIIWAEVEADSGDEAQRIVKNGEYYAIIDSEEVDYFGRFDSDNVEILEVELDTNETS